MATCQPFVNYKDPHKLALKSGFLKKCNLKHNYNYDYFHYFYNNAEVRDYFDRPYMYSSDILIFTDAAHKTV